MVRFENVGMRYGLGPEILRDISFTLDAGSSQPVVLLAGGIGITPFVGMLRVADAKSAPRRIRLFHANRRPGEAAFLRELLALAERNPALEVIPTMTGADFEEAWTGERGRIDAAMLDRYLGSAPATYYLAGPPTMARALTDLLHARGIGDDEIHVDAFYGYP